MLAVAMDDDGGLLKPFSSFHTAIVLKFEMMNL
jgi:hypothetical protein